MQFGLCFGIRGEAILGRDHDLLNGGVVVSFQKNTAGSVSCGLTRKRDVAAGKSGPELVLRHGSCVLSPRTTPTFHGAPERRRSDTVTEPVPMS